jgi:hypothetical protein
MRNKGCAFVGEAHPFLLKKDEEIEKRLKYHIDASTTEHFLSFCKIDSSK